MFLNRFPYYFPVTTVLFTFIFSLASADITGGQLSDLYSYGISSRIAAMGNAGRTIADDATAAVWDTVTFFL